MQAEIIKMVSMSPELLRKETILVRCKDCKYFDETIYACLCGGKMYGFPTNPDWFCADGERRTDP